MILDDIFFEEPKTKYKFMTWFDNHNIHGYDVNKMPQFMALPIVIRWLETKGLYIDRDIECWCMKIWDYRGGEPSSSLIIDCTYFEGPEEWQMDAIKQSICLLLNKRYDET